MFYSEDQINLIAHLVTDPLQKQGLLTFKDPNRALRIIKDELRDFFGVYEKIDQIVRKKISSQKKVVLEGSRDWEILYNKYLKEEADKHNV